MELFYETDSIFFHNDMLYDVIQARRWNITL
jgi:hypothetical protein